MLQVYSLVIKVTRINLIYLFMYNIIMTKVIRIKEETFEELVRQGKWSDTMDTIVSTLLKKIGNIEKEDYS